MKVNELIALLQKMPQDAPVVVMDSERSAYEASGDPSPEGLYYGFEVDLDTEMFFSFDRESIEDDPIPTVVISFESDYVEKQSELMASDKIIKDYEDREKLTAPSYITGGIVPAVPAKLKCCNVPVACPGPCPNPENC